MVLEQDAVAAEDVARASRRRAGPPPPSAAWPARRARASRGPARRSCASRRHSSCMLVMSASMCESLSWTSWKPAIGRPNCSRRAGVRDRGLVRGQRVAERLPGDRLAAWASTRSVSANVRAPARRLSAGTRTPRSVISACQTARLEALPVMTSASERRRRRPGARRRSRRRGRRRRAPRRPRRRRRCRCRSTASPRPAPSVAVAVRAGAEPRRRRSRGRAPSARRRPGGPSAAIDGSQRSFCSSEPSMPIDGHRQAGVDRR